ncbi:hypothetical protein GGH13_008451, partial [Coemansia sp. S155-1]
SSAAPATMLRRVCSRPPLLCPTRQTPLPILTTVCLSSSLTEVRHLATASKAESVVTGTRVTEKVARTRTAGMEAVAAVMDVTTEMASVVTRTAGTVLEVVRVVVTEAAVAAVGVATSEEAAVSVETTTTT